MSVPFHVPNTYGYVIYFPYFPILPLVKNEEDCNENLSHFPNMAHDSSHPKDRCLLENSATRDEDWQVLVSLIAYKIFKHKSIDM